MSAIEQIVNKPIKEMTAIEYLIYEKYIQWNQNGRPKDPRNDKAGHDAIQAAAELTAMQARFDTLEAVRKAAQSHMDFHGKPKGISKTNDDLLDALAECNE